MAVVPVVAMVVVKGRNVLAEVRKATDDFGAGAVWIPGGHLEAGETPEQAFFREAKEELNVQPVTYYPLCQLPWEHNGKQHMVHYFACTKWVGEIECREASELIWLDEDHLDRLDETVDREAIQQYLKKSENRD